MLQLDPSIWLELYQAVRGRFGCFMIIFGVVYSLIIKGCYFKHLCRVPEKITVCNPLRCQCLTVSPALASCHIQGAKVFCKVFCILPSCVRRCTVPCTWLWTRCTWGSWGTGQKRRGEAMTCMGGYREIEGGHCALHTLQTRLTPPDSASSAAGGALFSKLTSHLN